MWVYRRLHAVYGTACCKRSVVPANQLARVSSAEKIVTHRIRPNVTELGCDSKTATYGPFIRLREASGLQPTHCVIANMDAVVTVTALCARKAVRRSRFCFWRASFWLLAFSRPAQVTPHERSDAVVLVNERRIEETTMLSHGDVIRLGRKKLLVFAEPGRDLSVSEEQGFFSRLRADVIVRWVFGRLLSIALEL